MATKPKGKGAAKPVKGKPPVKAPVKKSGKRGK